MESKRLHRLIKFTISIYALFAAVTSGAPPTTTTCPDSSNCAALTTKTDTYFQEFGKESDSSMVGKMNGRRYLSGPGSFPPRCTAKCGRCTPCRPVHVPVPPGTPVTAEYYPEAWRCKCGNKLYMP